MTSIDLANRISGPLAATSITFVGVLVGGGTVTQTFQLPAQAGPAAFQTFTFDAAFTDLETLHFPEPDVRGYQFTNIRLGTAAATTAPEPATAVLLAAGLLALGGAVRSRRAA